MTQRILEALESDEVDSIADTEEASSIARIIEECYYEIVGRTDLPNSQDVFQLTASGDSSKPTVMYVPEQAISLDRIKYNDDSTTTNPSWYDVEPITFSDYLDITSSYDADTDEVGTFTLTNGLSQTFSFKYRNDQMPKYYTTFDDNTILFDAYDSSDSSTLVGAKTMCWGIVAPVFTLEDSFVPDLDARQFQLLLQSAKAQAFVEIKQIENPKAEKKERRNEILVQRTKDKVKTGYKYRRYGRK